MNRRAFAKLFGLGALALLFAPKIALPERQILYADGIHDDIAALNAWGRGETVYYPDGTRVPATIVGGVFYVTSTVHLKSTQRITGSWFFGQSNTGKSLG